MAKDGDQRSARQTADQHPGDERYRLFADATEEGVVIHDFERVLAANSHFAHMFGYPEEQIEGTNPFAFIAPEKRTSGDPTWQNAGPSDETIGIRADGSRFPIGVIARTIIYQGHPARIARIRDLTGRKQVEERINATEARFRATFEQAAIGIAHIAIDGSWLMANQRICDMTGYQRDELENLTFQDITHPDDLNADLELFNSVIAGERDNYSMEKRYFRKDGAVIWINLTVAVVRLHGGSPSYFISMIEDISARKEMEESLRQAQKMEVVGQLTSSIAHDFGNYLNVVKGNLQILQLSQLSGRSSEYVASALAGAELAEKLIRQLLSFSRRQDLELESFDINGLIHGIEELLRRAVHDGIDIQFGLEAIDSNVICDRTQLETAVFNLVLNARDALGSDAGEIVISTSAGHLAEAEMLNGMRAAGEYVSLKVRDTGHGMAPDVRARALEPFYTTKAAGQGTGLGLSQVARCVSQTKGFVQIDSEQGVGTEVQLFFPLSRGADL